jgi:orotidine-5'-phosphate decarboxylase
MDKGVLLLVFMSHKGAREGYGQIVYDVETGEKTLQYLIFAKKAIAWKADGVIVGALYPEKIREVSKLLGEVVPVYSPGIGAQGGNIQTTVTAGARYVIVGRAITLAENPEESVKKIRASINSIY